MEQNEHVLETEFGYEQSRGDDSFGQPTGLNETSFRNKTKMVDESEKMQEFKGDDVFSGEERQMSSISVNSDDVKNCLAIIAETYSSSDDEANPEKSAEPVNNEISLAEDGSCKEVGFNNFGNIGVGHIPVPEKGTSLEEQNNNLNNINLNDATSQITMIVEPEYLKQAETDGRTLIMQQERDGKTLMNTGNDGHTLIEPESGGYTLVEPESDGHVFTESKIDEHTVLETDSDGHTVMDTESDGHKVMDTGGNGHTPVEPTKSGYMVIKPERSGCTLTEPQNDGHIVEPGSGHTLIETGSDQSSPPESKSDRHALMKCDSDGHTLMKTDNDRSIPLKSESDGHMIIKSASDQRNPFKPKSDGDILMETEIDGHTLAKTDSDANIPIKSESDGHMLTEPASDQSNPLESHNRHALIETDCDGHPLVKGDIPINSESDGHMLTEPAYDGHTIMKTDCIGHTPMKTNSEGHMLINSENGGHTLLNTESNEHILTGPKSNGHRSLLKPDSEMCTLTEPKREKCSLIGSERHEDTPTCSDTGHQVYVMSSIDKELESIGEVGGTSHQTATLVERTAEDNASSSDSSSDDESSSSESESSESSSDDDLEDIRKEIEREEEHVHTGPLKTKSELSLKDLPEIPDFDIAIDEDVQLVELGVVFSIVESMVIVKALPQTPALDSESVLFLENRSCLGLVFETFGPVQTPFYSVRFNKDTDISDKNVQKGGKVFYAPGMMEYSNFVFVAQLKKLKGSDASWEHDEEPPQEVIEYSDDEEEAKAKANKKKERMARKGSSADDVEASKTEPSGTNDHQRPNRGGRKRTWQSRGRGQLANQNQNQGTPSSNPSSLQHPAFRGPAPQPYGALPPQAPAHMVHRPAFPPQRPFISHPTQEAPPFEMRHMGPPRGMPPRGPLGMMSQPMGPFPGPHPGPMGNVPIPSFAPSGPLIGTQHMQGHWPVGPPSGFAPRYSMPGTQGFQNPAFQSRDLHFVMPPPPPPPPNL